MCVATSTAIGLAVTAGTAGAGIIGAKLNSSAQRDAAKMQTDAATSAAAIQGQTADKTLAFQRQQAETDWQNAQQTQKANYDQWAAGQGRRRSLAAMTGINYGADPAYQPGIDPRFDTGATPLPGAAAPTTPGAPGAPPSGAIDWTAPPAQLSSQLSAWFKSQGVSDHETPFWVSKAGELVARGQQLGDPNYPMSRLLKADVFGGSGGSAAPSSTSNTSVAPAMPLTSAATPTLAPLAVQPYQQARRVFSFADVNGAR